MFAGMLYVAVFSTPCPFSSRSDYFSLWFHVFLCSLTRLTPKSFPEKLPSKMTHTKQNSKFLFCHVLTSDGLINTNAA